MVGSYVGKLSLQICTALYRAMYAYMCVITHTHVRRSSGLAKS
jgi:hypothetical protein